MARIAASRCAPRYRLLIAIGAVVTAFAFPTEAAEPPDECAWPPWDFAAESQPAEGLAPPEAVGPGHLPFSALMTVYQRFVSPVSGKHCPMYPSCSSYAKQAVHDHGTLLGVMMAFDRLHRCGHDLSFYEIVYVDGRPRWYDPPVLLHTDQHTPGSVVSGERGAAGFHSSPR